MTLCERKEEWGRGTTSGPVFVLVLAAMFTLIGAWDIHAGLGICPNMFLNVILLTSSNAIVPPHNPYPGGDQEVWVSRRVSTV